MEQTIMHNTRRAGWSDSETNLLWETADEAQQQGLALKSVFERIASETGRRPNSIRNYYYAQVRQRMGGQERAARFVPFEEDEVLELLEQVLRDRAKGKSVRSCLQRISNGDHSLMLRYQNKYRSVIKTRPELVKVVVDKLHDEGIQVETPEVKSRSRTSLSKVCRHMTGAAERQGDPELVRALETLSDYLLGNKSTQVQPGKGGMNVRLDLYRMALDEQRLSASMLVEAASELIGEVKEFLVLTDPDKQNKLPIFCEGMVSKIGTLEECVAQCEPNL
ncbi:hypothetical protein LJC33_04205 [Eubacteriales bacterium OttesenSCG-928-N13]|nr:hypothetical protein [Eubacteriales bacterium OttesenSCG-928-N13]